MFIKVLKLGTSPLYSKLLLLTNKWGNIDLLSSNLNDLHNDFNEVNNSNKLSLNIILYFPFSP